MKAEYSVVKNTSVLPEEQIAILADPQTSGGLMVSVDPDKSKEFEKTAQELGLSLTAFGKIVSRFENLVIVS